MSEDFPPGFRWSAAKNRANIVKHGIDFRDASRAFEKPTLDFVDTRVDYGETRTNSLGELNGQVVVNVTHTDRQGDIWLISARLATSRERERYLEFQLGLAQSDQTHDWAGQAPDERRRRGKEEERSRASKRGRDLDDDVDMDR